MPIGADNAFSLLLCQHRGRLGYNRAKVARIAGVDASYLTRLEHGDREPPRQYIVEALGRALGLGFGEMNGLLIAAGYRPLAAWSPALAAVAEIETEGGLTLDELSDFEKTILLVCQAWGRNRVSINGGKGNSLASGSTGDPSRSTSAARVSS